MSIRTLTVMTLLALGAVLTGCSSNADTICDRRRECIDDDLDTDRCADDINDWVEDKNTKDRRERVEECADCLSDRSCAEALERCLVDCAGIP
ncbi:hypothetical protein NVS55_35180 [Myxococcus stipitatus]|uniref:hypothetical protein n=1 Tax=Myxococcus stipitatus TaxID=83455 RepID=UPI003144EA8B